MNGDQQLVEEMLERFPELQDLYDVHVANNGALLPHVLFWDVKQDVLQCYLEEESDLRDWHAFLEFLEEEYGRDDKPAREVIVTSFLDSLPYPGQIAPCEPPTGISAMQPLDAVSPCVAVSAAVTNRNSRSRHPENRRWRSSSTIRNHAGDRNRGTPTMYKPATPQSSSTTAANSSVRKIMLPLELDFRGLR